MIPDPDNAFLYLHRRFGGAIKAMTVSPDLFEQLRQAYNYENFDTPRDIAPFLGPDATVLFHCGMKITKGETA